MSHRAHPYTHAGTPDSAFDTTFHSREIKNYFKVNKNENISCQNLFPRVKTVFRGTVMTSNVCIREEEISKINNINFHFGKLEKKEQIKPQISQ